MAQYTIEDIEILRQKSGISYEEAVNLLEYHNGSLARALVDLEKNGRLRDTKIENRKKGKTNGIFSYLYRLRLKVRKGDVIVLNLSSLFIIFASITALWVVIGGLVAAMVLGYRITIERNSNDFRSESFEDVVKSASGNVKSTIFAFAKDMGIAGGGSDIKQHNDSKEEPVRRENPATGTTPVNVQFPEAGRVDVREGADGFYEADIQ